MIKVVYDRTIPSVTMEGHAGSGEKGHDLVCAGASILACTLASLVKSMDEGVQVHSSSVELTDGGALISCEPTEDHFHSVRLMFDTICAGLDILAHEYPDNVSFTLVDEDKKGE
jgi:uncharacterized protein YsxB (DUF464 family)